MTVEFECRRFAPLVSCLRYALLPYSPLDKYVRSLLGEDGPGGGDPGWWIVWIDDEVGACEPLEWKHFMESSHDPSGCFEAWVDDEPGLSSYSYGYYSREEVFACVREQLLRFESYWPGRADEARVLSARFALPKHGVNMPRERWSLARVLSAMLKKMNP